MTPEPDEHQSREIERVCDFIAEHGPGLTLCAGDTRWTYGNILFRYQSDNPGMYAYMVGPLQNGGISLHLMPLYALPDLWDKHHEVFKPFIAGKSCIHFRNFYDLPLDALADVVRRGTPRLKAAMEAQLDKKEPQDKKETQKRLL